MLEGFAHVSSGWVEPGLIMCSLRLTLICPFQMLCKVETLTGSQINHLSSLGLVFPQETPWKSIPGLCQGFFFFYDSDTWAIKRNFHLAWSSPSGRVRRGELKCYCRWQDKSQQFYSMPFFSSWGHSGTGRDSGLFKVSDSAGSPESGWGVSHHAV